MHRWFGGRSVGVLLAAGVAFMAAFAPPASAAECYDAGAMARNIAESGMDWERRTEKVWRADLPSQTRGEVNVIAVCGEKFVPVFTILAYAKDLKPSRELFLLLLHAADHFDQVKFAVDADGDYIVRVDLWSETLTGAALAGAANQLALVVDGMTEHLRNAHANR